MVGSVLIKSMSFQTNILRCIWILYILRFDLKITNMQKEKLINTIITIDV